MPNHWHLVLRPRREKALSELMQWLTVTHVRRYYEHYPEKSGHLYQGRFKAFPVEEDRYFLVLCRYVEANAKRADLVDVAEKWQWSSLNQRITGAKTPPLIVWPLDRPRNWIEIVNDPPGEQDLKALHASITQGRPLGSERWIKQIATRTGLLHTLQSRGRPLKAIKDLSPRQKLRRLNIANGHKGA